MKSRLSLPNRIIHGITILITLVVLMDFALPGTRYTEDVVSVSRKKEKYYNAGGNWHNTYHVVTATRQFSVSKDVATTAEDKQIDYALSLLFKEVNGYKLATSNKNQIYSFRVVSGLVLPLLVFLAIGISYRFKKDLSLLLFILQVLTVGNLVMLIL
ncbi:hypothetical protein JM84_2254 [Dokdonia sp. Hel_I_63]|uniref:hypothetical protein n=1 Tax=Dokdonia sp. Hel_I_63 TaxID=1249996 RepID=UPI00119C1C15|nr:hypothetical protein [Dokdonia sp. Hel_I_63]TVZ23331.1 hypothetical protein JM84_2254 [Dokdonia sp. Hel_I_63]